MAGNSFGQSFKITSFGESHGPGIGVVIDGCPSGLALDMDFVSLQLKKRRPGQSKLTTQRNEQDIPKILSGYFDGKTTGTPLTLWIENQDQKSEDYSNIAHTYRPSHADYTYDTKYGFRDYRGGGRSSARETSARVAAGAVAQLILQEFGLQFHTYVSQIGHISLPTHAELDYKLIEQNDVRCPHAETANDMEKLILKIKDEGDSVGGIITCEVMNMVSGLGEPVFDRLEADLAKAMLSIQATKGFEIGSGFAGSILQGSQHNDIFTADEHGQVRTTTNRSGGVQGGISNGMPLKMRIAFKPTATIRHEQKTIDKNKNDATLAVKGRHDPCVLPRAVVIVESMAALVITDHLIRNASVRLDHLKKIYL